MPETPEEPTLDLVRWSFTIDPAQRKAIEDYLDGLGLDVLVRDDAHFLVTWDEPDESTDEVIEAIWAIHGEPFEVTQEEFHRRALLQIQHEDDRSAA